MLIFWEDCADVLQAPFTLHTHPAHVQCCSLVLDQLLCLLTLLSCFIFGVKVWIKKTLKLGQTFCLNHAHINTLCYITAVLFFTGPLFFFWGGGEWGRASFCFVSQIAPSGTRNFPSKTTSRWRERQFRRFSANSGGPLQEQDFL